jgi:hypothetical protein
MAASNTLVSESLPSSVPPAQWRRRRILRLGMITVAALAGIATLLLSWPVARISRESAARITPGMTVEQATAVVGAPPGWYDGVGMISTNAPSTKGDWHEWTGSQGTIILYPDAGGRVARATFYPALSLEQSLPSMVIERLTRSTEAEWQNWWHRW